MRCKMFVKSGLKEHMQTQLKKSTKLKFWTNYYIFGQTINVVRVFVHEFVRTLQKVS